MARFLDGIDDRPPSAVCGFRAPRRETRPRLARHPRGGEDAAASAAGTAAVRFYWRADRGCTAALFAPRCGEGEREHPHNATLPTLTGRSASSQLLRVICAARKWVRWAVWRTVARAWLVSQVWRAIT